MPTQYLSTDPNAGKESGGYLSTDPNAGAESKNDEPKKTPEKPARDWGDTLTDLLPTAGAMAGGLVGAPFGGVPGVALAGLGGAAGQAGRRVIQGLRGRQVPQGMDAALDIAKTGAVEGGLQAVGGVLGKGLAKGAGRLYQAAAKPSKALRADSPNLIETALRERIPLTSRGAQKVDAATSASAKLADDTIARAQAAGAGNVPTADVVSEFAPVVTELRKRIRIGQPSQLPAVGARSRQIVATNPSGIPLTEAQELKRAAQDAAAGAYRQLNTGAIGELSANDLTHRAVASGLRRGIEKKVPEVIPINQRTQALGGVRQMVEDAVGRTGNNNVIGMSDLIGTGIGGLPGLLLSRILNRPASGSLAAILMNDAARLGVPTGAARAAAFGQRTREEE